jgi:hypothetical protein
MNAKYNRPTLLLSAAIAGVMVQGLFALILAQEKQEIPDHAGFQACQPCHAEKQSMWEASNHPKAIGLISINNPAATECGSCHASKSLANGQPGSAAGAASKEIHHKISCLACHARQKSEYDHRLVMAPEKLCDVCHTQRAVFLGKGAKGIEDSRNFHSGVPCVSCHMTEGNHRMKVLRPDDAGLSEKRQDTCTACHMDNNREARVEQIQDWQSTHSENVTPLLADIKIIDEKLKAKPDLLNAELKSKFDDVKTNLSILEKDGSKGFHNFVFSLEITSLAADALKEIKAAVQ